MKKQELPDSIIELISTYLSGNATDDQVVTLEKWVQNAQENKAAFVEFKKTWLLSNINQSNEQLDLSEEWNNIKAKTTEKLKVVPLRQTSQTRKWLSIAAGVAILIVAGFWISNFLGDNNPVNFTTTEYAKNESLSDGSNVHLNQSSSLVFSPDDGGRRTAQLTGDAFFDIARDTVHPFEIIAGDLKITVLGTSFYVDSRLEEKNSQVIVSSGKVSVKAFGNSVILEKGETATFDKSEKSLVKSVNNDNNYLGWRNNTLSFNHSSLEDVVFVLNRHYNAEIKIENQIIKDCKLTAEYKDKSLEAVIRIIEATLGIEASINGKVITLKGEGC